jgi:hypothetical protein
LLAYLVSRTLIVLKAKGRNALGDAAMLELLDALAFAMLVGGQTLAVIFIQHRRDDGVGERVGPSPARPAYDAPRPATASAWLA